MPIGPRRSEFLSMSQADFDASLQTVSDAFGAVWLETEGNHKLQELWSRRDPLATTELVTLGQAIVEMRNVDSDWVTTCVDRIRSDSRTSHGMVFELVGLAMLVRAGMRVTPASDNFKGMDATIGFDDGYEIRVSMKNHDMSSHESEFRKQSLLLHEQTRKAFPKRSHSAQTLVRAKRLPGSADWSKLAQAVDKARTFTPLALEQPASDGITIRVTTLHPHRSLGKFAPNVFSDSFLAIAPHHANEQKNFLEKIERAAGNMLTHVPARPNSANMVFMRVHPTASLAAMVEYATGIVNHTDEPGIDGILLYQPAVVRDYRASPEFGDPVVAHHMQLVTSQRIDLASHPVGLAALIGVITPAPARQELHIGNAQKLTTDGHYILQIGDHYYASQLSGLTQSGDVVSVAPGILAHRAFTMNNQTMYLSGLFPRQEELFIV